MNIWTKVILIPIVAFLLMIISVGVLGSFVEYTWIKDNLQSGFPVFVWWVFILSIIVGIQTLRTKS